MRPSWRPVFIPVGIVVALALAFTSAVAQATGGGRIAAACSNETVTVLELKPVAVTLRFVLHGVSCNRAHGLIRTFFRHQATPGNCRNRGNICAFVSGGYVCSLSLYAGEGGGDFAACARESPPATVVKVFKVNSAAPRASASRSCGSIYAKDESQTMKVTVARGRVSCAQARQTMRSFFSGHGTQHGGPSESTLYWVLAGGWRCQLATGGGGGCFRDGSNFLHARESIGAAPLGRDLEERGADERPYAS
jgi:hypothetical protein